MHIIDDVEKRDLSDYTKATRSEIDQLRTLKAVTAVYSTGMVKAPGISDLDLIVVIDVDRAGRTTRDLKRAILLPVDRYIRTHPMFVVSPTLFRNVRWLADLSTLDCVYGQEIEVDPAPEQYTGLFRAVTIVETGIHKLFALRRMLVHAQPSARSLLLGLNSIAYSLLLATELQTVDHSMQASMTQFRDEVTQVRSSWFKEPKTQRMTVLRELIERAPDLLCCAFDMGSEQICELLGLDDRKVQTGIGNIPIEPAGNLLLRMDRQTCRPPEWEPSFLDWVGASRQQGRTEFRGPLGMAVPFAYQLARLRTEPKQFARMSRHVQLDATMLQWCLSAETPLCQGLERRADLMRRYAKWYRPFWGFGLSFSPHTMFTMGRRTRIEKVRCAIERTLLRRWGGAPKNVSADHRPGE